MNPIEERDIEMSDRETETERWEDVEGGENEPKTPERLEVEEVEEETALGGDEGLSQDGEVLEGQITPGRSDQEELAEGDEESRMQEDEEEGREAKENRTGAQVSKKERERHELTHCPYRSWCPYCVQGRAHKRPHKAKTKEDKEEVGVPRVSMDYFYMSTRDEEAKEFSTYSGR